MINKKNVLDSGNPMTWIGCQEDIDDRVTEAPIKGMQATLNHKIMNDLEGSELPALWHWLYFLPSFQTSKSGADGHVERGGFFPPISLPCRMWAGGIVEFISPLKVGDNIKKISTITNIEHKVGKKGELVFVTVNHHIYQGKQLAIRERQDLVYRGITSPDTAKKNLIFSKEKAQWSVVINPTELMLFRYSALTFNAHRIHYDKDYAIGVENYEGLVVQGPLIVTLLLDTFFNIHPNVKIEKIKFRGVRPLFVTLPFWLEGCWVGQDIDSPEGNSKQKKILLWAKDVDGAVAMQAEVYVALE